ncbi:MAG TPA: ATP cone domain-containing protein, partial [Candidatus Hodarchaeales archaeon]|nr:ATP cone domain-containing protein [Candidatus Hodarchaeales archaeon]
MPIYKVQKRSGGIVDFNLSKIEQAIEKAAEAVEQKDVIAAQVLSGDVYAQLEEQFEDGIPN